MHSGWLWMMPRVSSPARLDIDSLSGPSKNFYWVVEACFGKRYRSIDAEIVLSNRLDWIAPFSSVAQIEQIDFHCECVKKEIAVFVPNFRFAFDRPNCYTIELRTDF